MEEYEAHLRAHEEHLFQDLHDELEQWDLSKLSKWIGKMREGLEVDPNADLITLIFDAVDDAFLTVRQRLAWVDLARSATIHRVRVAFKAFRYMVEIVHPLLRDFPPDMLKQMDDYQTRMGNIQDVEVFARTLDDFTENATFPELDAVHRYYERRRSEAISKFIAAKDQLHTFWRPAPDEPFPWEQSR